ncbi:hypothetical protein NTGHW29_600001 [Candidatus Nitrotoga sp. HW29]|nr:hypothetical protein NTGHW29_600001 [Candidatus Nitrotoga sp. HW29]
MWTNRQAQAVVLPLQYGISLEQTAQVIGLSKGWACRLRNQFIAGGAVGDKGKSVRGGRHREHFTPEREAELLKPFLESASIGDVLAVSQIKPQLEMALGREISVYKLLHRHNWRKLAPDKRPPQSNPVAQEDWKKTPRNTCRNPPELGQKRTDPTDVSGRSAFWAHQRRASLLGSQTHTTTMPSYADPRVHLRLRSSRGQKWGARFFDLAVRQYRLHAVVSR